MQSSINKRTCATLWFNPSPLYVGWMRALQTRHLQIFSFFNILSPNTFFVFATGPCFVNTLFFRPLEQLLCALIVLIFHWNTHTHIYMQQRHQSGRSNMQSSKYGLWHAACGRAYQKVHSSARQNDKHISFCNHFDFYADNCQFFKYTFTTESVLDEIHQEVSKKRHFADSQKYWTTLMYEVNFKWTKRRA